MSNNASKIPHASIRAIAILLTTLAFAAAAACLNNTPQIKRADHDTLPTPTRGYFYPLEDENGNAGPSDAFDDGPFVDDSDDFISTDEIAANPELAQLFEKIESGTATDADYQRFSDIIADGSDDAFGFGTSASQTVAGTITEFSGNTAAIVAFPDPDDEATPTTDQPEPTNVTLSDETQVLLVRNLQPSDIQPGEEISATAERNEEGRIRARTISILDVDEDSPFAVSAGPASSPPGFGRSPFSTFGGRGDGGSRTITTEGDTTIIEIVEIRTETRGSAPVIGASVAGIPASGRVTKVEGQTVHVEARQGPLRITIDDQSITARATQGTLRDITTGMAAVATIADDGNAITIAIGPAELINLDEADRFQWLTPIFP